MKKETFLELLSDIDDDLIEEAEEIQKKSNRNFIKYISTAACICIVLGGSLIGSYLENEQHQNTGKSQKNQVYEEKIAMAGDSSLTEKSSNKEEASIEEALESGWYDGEGTGEFIYNNKIYHIVNSQEYLLSNSLPVQVNPSDVGSNLANNVQDTANNTIGNIYEYNNGEGETILIVQGMDGIYNIAVEK